MFKLPNLPYDYSALEPYIDKQTMELHHTKHHQAYVDNLNKALEKYPKLQSKNIEELLLGNLPSDIKEAVINNGGGHFNHSFFWEAMTPKSSGKPEGELAKALDSTFGSFEVFKEQFTKKALTIFGSGWAWLLLTPKKNLILKRHSFQNPPIVNGNKPILGLDVWEHSYYLQYKWEKAKYINNWWNVVNWSFAEKNFLKAK